MISLKINGEKKQIPAADELTVKQYSEFVKQDKQDIISYLSVTLGITYKQAFYSKLNNIGLLKRIGTVKQYDLLKPKKKILLKDGTFYYIPEEITTIGQRFMIEENAAKLEEEEYLCFVLAVGLVNDPMNLDSVNNLKEKLMNESYTEILPTAFFLLRNLSNGKNSVMNFSRELIQSIKIRISKNN